MFIRDHFGSLAKLFRVFRGNFESLGRTGLIIAILIDSSIIWFDPKLTVYMRMHTDDKHIKLVFQLSNISF